MQPDFFLSCAKNSAKPLADTGINTSSKEPCILLTQVSENPSHMPSISPCPQETKMVATVTLPS